MSDSSSAEFVRSTFFADGDKTQEVIFGNRICDELGERAKSFGTHAYLVTDSGLSKAGHPQRVCRILTSAGIKVTTYDQSKENPSDSSVQECAECAREAEIDLIIGLGGGSSMDTAKGCNFLVTNGGSMSDYWGINKTTHPMLPMIAIPTTAGTGSETGRASAIINEKTLEKICDKIDLSKTVLWNGPAGYFENENFKKGTISIAKKISDNTKNKSLISIIGGGDTLSAINRSKEKLFFTHLSTAGGAFLEFLEGKDLPGLSVLK